MPSLVRSLYGHDSFLLSFWGFEFQNRQSSSEKTTNPFKATESMANSEILRTFKKDTGREWQENGERNKWFADKWIKLQMD